MILKTTPILKFSNWWLQPLWNIFVKLDDLSKVGFRTKSIWNDHLPVVVAIQTKLSIEPNPTKSTAAMVYLNQPFGNFKSATRSLNSSEKKNAKNTNSLGEVSGAWICSVGKFVLCIMVVFTMKHHHLGEYVFHFFQAYKGSTSKTA